MRTSVTIYLIPQHFSWLKNLKLLILKLVPGAFFTSAKTINAFVDTDLLLMMMMVAQSQDFHIKFVKGLIDLENS